MFVRLLEKLTNDKHSSLLRKYVIYGQKSFITMGPGPSPTKSSTHAGSSLALKYKTRVEMTGSGKYNINYSCKNFIQPAPGSYVVSC